MLLPGPLYIFILTSHAAFLIKQTWKEVPAPKVQDGLWALRILPKLKKRITGSLHAALPPKTQNVKLNRVVYLSLLHHFFDNFDALMLI